MFADVIALFPPWVVLGVLLGSVASVLVAVVFYVGNRISPPTDSTPNRGEVSGDARRRVEIREYLRAIDEVFREDHSVGGTTVPFYLPQRAVAITFDAHDYFQLEGEGVFTVLCEHEMPGYGLGRRLPFDVREPESGTGHRDGSRVGPRDGSHADPVNDAFAELGLPADAAAADVKRAYRERVKEVHPDQGGSEEAFRRLREAYATAKNHAEGDASTPEPAPGFGRQ